MLTGEDWYGDDLSGRVFTRTRFVDCDLTEVTSTGALFEECHFVGCRLNASVHRSTVFARCVFRRTSLFSAELHDCKLVGSSFDLCTMRPLTVKGGDWSYTSLARANLTGVDFTGVRLDEADLAGADLSKAVFRGARMARCILEGAILAETELSGADLAGVDLGHVRWDRTKLDSLQLLQVAASLGIEVTE